MKRNMDQWLNHLVLGQRAVLPILSSPGIHLIGANPGDVFKSGELQFQAIKAITDRFPMAAALTMMDLSVEAEAFGAAIKWSEHENPTVAAPLAKDETEIDRIVVPMVGAGRTGETLKAATLCAESILDRPTLGGLIGPFSLVGRLLEMSRLMVLTMTEPQIVHQLLEKATCFLIEYAKAFKNTGCNGLLMAEPAAGLISPAMCQQFSSDYIRRIVDSVKDDHFIFVLHNCGKTEKQVKAMLSTGASAIHVGNAVDILTILEQVPRDYPVMGNIDPTNVFLLGTPELIGETTRNLLERTKEYPNHILSSGCDIPAATPLANVEAFFINHAF